jgi:hypothetical protein
MKFFEAQAWQATIVATLIFLSSLSLWGLFLWHDSGRALPSAFDFLEQAGIDFNDYDHLSAVRAFAIASGALLLLMTVVMIRYRRLRKSDPR